MDYLTGQAQMPIGCDSASNFPSSIAIEEDGVGGTPLDHMSCKCLPVYVLKVPLVLGTSPSRPATLVVACLIATANALKADSAL